MKANILLVQTNGTAHEMRIIRLSTYTSGGDLQAMWMAAAPTCSPFQDITPSHRLPLFTSRIPSGTKQAAPISYPFYHRLLRDASNGCRPPFNHHPSESGAVIHPEPFSNTMILSSHHGVLRGHLVGATRRWSVEAEGAWTCDRQIHQWLRRHDPGLHWELRALLRCHLPFSRLSKRHFHHQQQLLGLCDRFRE